MERAQQHAAATRAPLRVLMLTRRIDTHDRQYSGFTHDWVAELAGRVEAVTVVCCQAGPRSLPSNVEVIAVGAGPQGSRQGMLLGFQRAVWRRMRCAHVVFAHPSPQFALAAAPAAAVYRVPVVLWYTSGVVKPALRLAHHLVDRVVTASPESYPLRGEHVTVIGHGIDFGRFAPRPRASAPGPRKVLSVGRLMPQKDLLTLVEACGLLLRQPCFADVCVRLVGEEPEWSRGYRGVLEARIAALGLTGRVRLVGGVPYADIVETYRGSTLVVSTSRVGAVDKVPLEAMGCGLPVVLSEAAYAPVLGADAAALLARPSDPHDLAEKLAGVLVSPAHERQALGLRLRQRAREQHDLGGLMDRLVGVLCAVSGRSCPLPLRERAVAGSLESASTRPAEAGHRG